MSFESIAAFVIAVLALSGVAGKILIDKEMSLREGAPIAVLFALWGYLQVRIATGSGEHLQGLALGVGVVALIVLGQFYWRNPPGRRKRQLKTKTALGSRSDS